MRSLVIGLRRAAMEAYNAGKIPYKPAYDIRSDYEYWRDLAEKKGIRIPVRDEIKSERTERT